MRGHHHPIEQLPPQRAMELHQAGQVHLVDVREKGEWEEVRIPGSTLLPLSQFRASYRELPRDKPLILVCAMGSRSGQAAHFLLHEGFQAANLAGGIAAWMQHGLPTEP